MKKVNKLLEYLKTETIINLNYLIYAKTNAVIMLSKKAEKVKNMPNQVGR